MRLLFLSLYSAKSIFHERHIYPDLLREFVRRGWDVVAVCPGLQNGVIEENKNVKIITIKIEQIQKSRNLIKKGIATLCVAPKFKRAIKRYLSDVTFDLILYPTPPITLASVVRYVKKRDNAKTYLLLKDIFPQNAVDLGMMTNHGFKSVVYRYFRRKEKQLYSISDRIGCMSPANMEYVIYHNPEVEASKVEVCPNCIEVQEVSVTTEERVKLRKKFSIPFDKKVFVYGGNLGKPQGVPFIVECLRACLSIDEAFFFIVGSGTDYGLIDEFVKTEKPMNVQLLPSLPKDEYDHMIAVCDVGLIFLDHRFTIPNFPSRLLSYMQAGLPVLACTDTATDVGKVIADGGFGWWCESNNVAEFKATVLNVCRSNIKIFGNSGYKYLLENYTAKKVYEMITGESVKIEEELSNAQKALSLL